MAGTVSAGTYKSGSLIELDTWLSKWEEAKVNKAAIKLVAQKDHGIYKKGDLIELNPNEIPDQRPYLLLKKAKISGLRKNCSFQQNNLFFYSDQACIKQLEKLTNSMLTNHKSVQKLITI